MANPHGARRTDIGLRMAGLALWGLAYACLSHLLRQADVNPAHLLPQVLGGGLAVVGILSASAGSAAAILGHRLFDDG